MKKNKNSDDKIKRLSRVWGILYFNSLTLLALVLVVPLLYIYDYWRSISRGELRPEGIAWQLPLSIAGAVLLLVCFPLFEVWAELKTEFTELGISKLGYLERKFIRWSDINQVKIYGQYVELKTANQSIKLNTLYYKDTAAFFQLILDSAPQSATWHMPKKMRVSLEKDRPD